MDTLKFFVRLKRKFLEPRVYSIVVKDLKDRKYLRMVTAYRLEDAFGSVVAELRKDFGKGDEMYKIFLWDYSELENIMKEVSETDITAPEKQITLDAPLEKNSLMEKIIASKDTALLEQNLALFNEEEKKYIKNKIK